MRVLDDFKEAHTRIEAELNSAEAVSSDPSQLLTALKAMRRGVLTHFSQKDGFYVALAAQCVKANDTAAAQLTRIFESNMKMQSSAVMRFFEGLDNASPESVSSGFRTLSTVIRQRFGTEEKAVFPLFKRTADKPKEES